MNAAQRKPDDGGGKSPANLYNKTHILLGKLKTNFREQAGKNITILEITHMAVQEFYSKHKDNMAKFNKPDSK